VVSIQFEPKRDASTVLKTNTSAGVSVENQSTAFRSENIQSESKPLSQAQSLAFRSQNAIGLRQAASTPRFQGAIASDYGAEIRGNVPINAYTVSQLLQSLLLRDLKKGEDDQSTLKFYLGAMFTTGYPNQDQTALADMFTLIDRPVDVVIKSATTPDGMFALMSATGKRFMYPGATLIPGALRTGTGYRKNKDFQVDRSLFNTYMRDLEYRVMDKTGVKDRAQIHEMLMSDREYNGLEALGFGKKGLIDGILIGHDQVITRKNLDAFFTAKKWTAAKDQGKIDAFCKDYMNIYQLKDDFTTPLAKFSKQSLPAKGSQLSPFESMADMLKKEDEEPHLKMIDPETVADEGVMRLEGTPVTVDTNQAIETDDGVFVKVNMPESPPKEMTFYVAGHRGVARTKHLPLNAKAMPFHKYQRMEVEHAPANPRGILDDDVIYFNDAFMDSTAEQIAEALVALDVKKQKEQKQLGIPSSNIKILENSPGGSVWSGQELRSTINSLKTPVDVIVTGMGASCGSWLLCSATGKRYATPNARIMIHEAASSQGRDNAKSYNEAADGLHQATVNYVQIVAESTGRPFKDVWTDFKLDVWFNPLESLFYGKNGLIDGILVGPNQVITRKDVDQYLMKKLGSRAKVNQYVQAMIEKKREPNLGWQPGHHDEQDAFENNLKVIDELAKVAKPLNETKGFSQSIGLALEDENHSRHINLYNVIPSPWDLLDDDDDGKGAPAPLSSPQKQPPAQNKSRRGFPSNPLG
jgi:ATP-dependent Clp protease, protease subunit